MMSYQLMLNEKERDALLLAAKHYYRALSNGPQSGRVETIVRQASLRAIIFTLKGLR